MTGEINDDYGKTLSRLNDVGIAIEDQSGNLLSATDILTNVGDKWDELSTQEQKYLANGFGVYQVNRFQALVKGMTKASGEYVDNLEVAYNSMGAVDKKYEEHSKSIKASTERMNNEWKELYQNTINSGFIISMVDAIGTIVNFIDESNLLVVGLIGLGTAFLLLKAGAIASFMTMMIETIVVMKNFGIASALLLHGINLLVPAVVLITGAVAGLVYMFKQADAKLLESKVTVESLTKSMDEQEQSVSDVIGSIEDLIGVEELSDAQKVKLESSYDALTKIMPEIIGLVDKETASAQDMAKAYYMVADAKKQSAIETLKLQRVELAKRISDAEDARGKVQPQGVDKMFGGGILGFEAGSLSQSITQKITIDAESLRQLDKDIKELEDRKIKIPSLEDEFGKTNSNVTTNSTGKDSSEKSVDPLESLQKYRDAIDAVTLSLSALEAEKASATDEEMVGILERENEQYKLRQIAMHEYKLSLDVQAKTLKKDSKTYAEDLQKIRDEQKKLGLEWWDDEKAIQSNIKAIGELEFKIIEANNKIAEAQKKSLDDLREVMEDYIKSGIEQQIKEQEKLLDLAKEELDVRLANVDAEEDLRRFAKDRADLEEDILKDTNEINKLRIASNQGDAKAQAKLLELQEARGESQEALDELVNEKSVEATKNKLKEEYDLYEKSVDNRIESLKEELADSGSIIRKANDMLKSYLNGSATSLYTDLINWNSKYGTGMDSDIISKWESAIGLVKKYNATLSGGFSFDGATSAIDNTGKTSIIEKMKKNSALWSSSSASEKKRLNEENKSLASSIGYSYSPDGKYYPTDISQPRVALYDNGGLKPKGEVGILGQNVKEWIFDDDQLKSIQKMAITEYTKSPTVIGSNITNSSSPSINIVIEGSISDNNLTRITNEIKDVVTKVSQGQLDTFRSRGIKLSPSTR